VMLLVEKFLDETVFGRRFEIRIHGVEIWLGFKAGAERLAGAFQAFAESG
jgi:hypothetical protein